MFQDIEPHSFCNDFAWVEPESSDRILIYRGSSVLVAKSSEGTLHFPSYDVLRMAKVVGESCELQSEASSIPLRLDGQKPSALLLFTVGDTAYFRCEINDEALEEFLSGKQDEAQIKSQNEVQDEAKVEARIVKQGEGQPEKSNEAPSEISNEVQSEISNEALSEIAAEAQSETQAEAQPEQQSQLSYEFIPVAQLRNYQPKHRVFAGMVGYEYHVWYDTHHFCGRCGSKMQHGIVERMLQCPECGCMEFSRLFPAVIIGIVDRQRNKVLVSRYAGRQYKSYALIAGFCEMGETVEQTVHREVMEEVGLKVTNLRYYKSQPWPPSSSLLFGFFCDLDGESSITLDDHELEEAEWLSREDLPDDEDYSLTREMMGVLRKGEETKYPLAFYR